MLICIVFRSVSAQFDVEYDDDQEYEEDEDGDEVMDILESRPPSRIRSRYTPMVRQGSRSKLYSPYQDEGYFETAPEVTYEIPEYRRPRYRKIRQPYVNYDPLLSDSIRLDARDPYLSANTKIRRHVIRDLLPAYRPVYSLLPDDYGFLQARNSRFIL
ncbi:hypothetical protein HDE_03837 [Halotydeus destructor]|nr:hypothetical protein HDE_03837 [Halotydeus destructor]